jgi:drug/metabolite transporter (DMT)-like permease
MSKHLKAVLLAVLVTVIWSTSWVFIKIGLREIPALTFAGLRYFIAFLCLLPFLFQKENWRQIRSFGKKDWLTLSLFGLVIYTLAQGAQYLALAYLPSVTVSLLLNLSTLFVAFSGMVILQEKPSWLQWGGVFLNLAGITIYFLPVSLAGGAWLGYIFAFVSLAANIGGTLQGREVNRSGKYSALVVTIVSMGIGSAIMLIAGIAMQGLPPISLQGWGIVLLLAVVNTAFCFTMWNYIQQTLTAMEASLINSTMVAEVAALTWIFLGESLTGREIFGLALSIVGVLIVQINLGPRKAKKKSHC